MWQLLSEGIAGLEAEEQALKSLVKDAVVQQDREFDEAEKKRKRIAELAAAEAEASKRARVEAEDSVRSPTSVASPVLDAATIAQIAEQVRASLSVADLVKMLKERKESSEPSKSSRDVNTAEKKDDPSGEDMD